VYAKHFKTEGIKIMAKVKSGEGSAKMGKGGEINGVILSLNGKRLESYENAYREIFTLSLDRIRKVALGHQDVPKDFIGMCLGAIKEVTGLIPHEFGQIAALVLMTVAEKVSEANAQEKFTAMGNQLFINFDADAIQVLAAQAAHEATRRYSDTIAELSDKSLAEFANVSVLRSLQYALAKKTLTPEAMVNGICLGASGAGKEDRFTNNPLTTQTGKKWTVEGACQRTDIVLHHGDGTYNSYTHVKNTRGDGKYPPMHAFSEQEKKSLGGVSQAKKERIVSGTYRLVNADDLKDYAAKLKAEPNTSFASFVKQSHNLSHRPRLSYHGPVAALDLTGADFTGVDFSHATFASCTLNGANLTGTRFYQAQWKDVKAHKANVRDTFFAHSSMENVDWQDTLFVTADFRSADLSGATNMLSTGILRDARTKDPKDGYRNVAAQVTVHEVKLREHSKEIEKQRMQHADNEFVRVREELYKVCRLADYTQLPEALKDYKAVGGSAKDVGNGGSCLAACILAERGEKHLKEVKQVGTKNLDENIAKCLEILAKEEVDLNERWGGDPLLAHAARLGYVQSVKTLLRLGANAKEKLENEADKGKKLTSIAVACRAFTCVEESDPQKAIYAEIAYILGVADGRIVGDKPFLGEKDTAIGMVLDNYHTYCGAAAAVSNTPAAQMSMASGAVSAQNGILAVGR
jgi:hypothetical protein